MMRRYNYLVVVLALTLAVNAQAEPRAGDFSVHELSLWIVDSASPMANAKDSFSSAFPATVNSSRTPRSSLSEGIDAPVALLTFYGTPSDELDVELRIKSGGFVGHWPSGESMPNRLRWARDPGKTALVEKVGDPSLLMLVDEENWIHRARGGETLFVRHGARIERFLAYDAELNLASPLRLQGGPDKFTVANVSGATVYDVLIARRTPEGIRVAWLDELAKAVDQPAKTADAATKAAASPSGRAAGLFGASRKPAQAPAAKEQPDNKGATGLFGVAAKPAAPAPKEPPNDKGAKEKDAKEKPAQDKPNSEKPAQKKPAPGLFGVAGKPPASAAASASTTVAEPAAAAKAPSASEKPLRGGVEITLSEPMPAGSPAAADATTKALADRLARRGLAAQEIDTFVAQYGPLLFESDDLVVACRLDAGVIDEKVALSIFPLPTKIVRVPILVMRNADPQLPGQIARLIAQLGDADFAAREAAEKRLIELGPLAFEALKKSINDDDMEIVIRSERILLKQNQQAAGRQGVSGTKGASAAKAAGAAQPVGLINGVLKIFGR